MILLQDHFFFAFHDIKQRTQITSFFFNLIIFLIMFGCHKSYKQSETQNFEHHDDISLVMMKMVNGTIFIYKRCNIACLNQGNLDTAKCYVFDKFFNKKYEQKEMGIFIRCYK